LIIEDDCDAENINSVNLDHHSKVLMEKNESNFSKYVATAHRQAIRWFLAGANGGLSLECSQIWAGHAK
jgi:hypothetical protein